MSEYRVARRYAKALLDLAIEQKITDQVYADQELILERLRNSAQFNAVLRNPIIHIHNKKAILSAVSKGRVSDLTSMFLQQLADKGRLGNLGEIARQYVAMYKEMNGIRTAHVTTATSLDAGSREQMLRIVRNRLGEKAELKEHVDPSIIGGFILRVNDVQYDTSVTRKLEGIKRQLLSQSSKSI